jgi:acetate---CoA ligase (ADP-forming)
MNFSYLTILCFAPLPAKILGVNIQEFVTNGKEMIIGMKRDPQFGPLLMFGLGVIYVEIIKDVSFRLAPLKELGALHMIESTKADKNEHTLFN